MTNANVIFKAEKVSHGWQIKCYCPGGKIEYVTGFWDEQSTQKYRHASSLFRGRSRAGS